MAERIEYLPSPGVPYRETEQAREAKRFYDSARWKDKIRPRYLKLNPLCEVCKAEGRTKAATHVHHKVERHLCEDPYDMGNLQGLCHSCHTKHHNMKRSKG